MLEKLQSRWYLFPPALALLLVLGPFRAEADTGDGSRPARDTTAPSTPDSSTEPAAVGSSLDRETTTREAAARRADERRDAIAEHLGADVPDLPGLWQVASALGGVLLLGTCAVLLVNRLRNGPTAGAGGLTRWLSGLQARGTTGGSRAPAGDAPGPIVEHRQSMRLSAKARVHVLQFQDRLVLVGEADSGLCLLQTGTSPEAQDDEITALGADAEQGAVPRDLAVPAPRPRRVTARSTALEETTSTPAASAQLADFRGLLQRARRRVPS